MRLHWIFVLGIGVLPIPAAAICLSEPLEAHLRAAEVIYVGTVTESKLTSPLADLAAARSPHRKIGVVRNILVPELVFRGDPSQAPAVNSSNVYSGPTGPFLHFGELVTVSPGDTLLVVARSGETPSISLCSASRAWDSETSKLVTNLLGPAP